MVNKHLAFELKVLADTRQAVIELKQFNENLKHSGQHATAVAGQMNQLAGQVKGLVGAWLSMGAVKSIIGIADQYGQMAARIELATASTEEYEKVQQRLYESTYTTYRSLEEAQELYIQTADALRELGYGTNEVLDVGESLSVLFVTNATNSQRAASAINAFSSSLQTGKVAAMNWQSLLMATPTLVDNIAAATGKSAAEIRQLGASGNLALTDLTEGLRLSLHTNTDLANQMQTSVSDALTRLKTSWENYIGELDKGGRHTGKLVAIIEKFEANLDNVINVTITLAGALAITFGAQQLNRVIAYGKELIELSKTATYTGNAINKAGIVAAAGWVGWAIGDYLQKEFKYVQYIGAHMIEWARKTAARIQYAFEMAFTFIKGGSFETVRQQLATQLKTIERDTLDALDAIDDEFTRRQTEKENKAPVEERAVFDPSQLRQPISQTSTSHAITRARTDDLERYVAGLEKQAATLGMNQAQLRAYELAEKQLTGTLHARAQAALAVLAADEARQQAVENARANAQLETELWRAQGKAVEAALAELRADIENQRHAFAQAGNTVGQAFLDQLLPLAEAKIRLDDIEQAIQATLARQQQAESHIAALRQSGALNDIQAQERLLHIHRQTAQELDTIRPQLETIAELGGATGEAAQAALMQMDSHMQHLLSTCSLLENTLSDGLQSGLTHALTGLAKGTMDLRGAIMALAVSVQEALLKMAAQNIAQSLVSNIMGAFGPAKATLQQGAVAVSQSAVQMQAAGGSLTTGAAAVSAAAQQLVAASASMGASNAAGGLLAGAGSVAGVGGRLPSAAGGAKAASGGFSMGWAGAALMAGSMFGSWLKRRAQGGIVTGPGSGTSDSIPALLSNGEYVIRASVTHQPGMHAILDAINQRGLAALSGLKKLTRHSTGGLAGIPASHFSAPSFDVSEISQRPNTTVENQITVGLVDNPDRIGHFLSGAKGQTVLLDIFNKYPNEFKQALGVN